MCVVHLKTILLRLLLEPCECSLVGTSWAFESLNLLLTFIEGVLVIPGKLPCAEETLGE